MENSTPSAVTENTESSETPDALLGHTDGVTAETEAAPPQDFERYQAEDGDGTLAPAPDPRA